VFSEERTLFHAGNRLFQTPTSSCSFSGGLVTSAAQRLNVIGCTSNRWEDMVSRRYGKPPIVEAVCEFRFDPSSPWDLAIPGLLYETLKERFPQREPVRAIESAVQVGEPGIYQTVAATDRVRFRSHRGDALVQVGQHFLSLNHFTPYPTWERFRPMAADLLTAYRSVAYPSGITRVGLRYINRITVPVQPSVELEDYFNFFPGMVGPLRNLDYVSFLVGVQLPFEKERDALRLQFTSDEPEDAATGSVLLDLDYFLAQPGSLDFDSLEGWLDAGHRRLEDVFEGCLRDTARSLFEVEG
jgi:uncharacterized protein (TIGR04255 family)